MSENKLFTFIFFPLILIFAFLFFNAKIASAQSLRYPIEELGHCRDAYECYLYCQIPKNTPACWSYKKYVMEKESNVLGEETINITYPIPELGNCQDAQTCFLYCAKPENQAVCLDFGKKQGLIKETREETSLPVQIIEAAKTELGCEGKNACMAFCHQPENMEKCREFGQKYGLSKPPKKPPPSFNVLKIAKSELGCDSEISCRQMCNQPENLERCMEFAKKHQLIEEEEIEKYEQYRKESQESFVKRKAMIAEAQKELGCESFDSCHQFCSKPENREKCLMFAQKFAPPLQPPPKLKETSTNLTQTTQQTKGPGGCTEEKECQEYCQKHPQECPGFPQMNSSWSSEKSEKSTKISPSLGKPSEASSQKSSEIGDFLGPAGCKTEKECRAYCEKHPEECPGFPKTKFFSPSPSPSSLPTAFPLSLQPINQNLSPKENKQSFKQPSPAKNLTSSSPQP